MKTTLYRKFLLRSTCFFITARKRSSGKVMFLQLSVILFTGIPPPSPQEQVSPRADPPSEQTHLPEQTPPPGSRHHPCAVHAGRYGQQAGGMHPTGMQSCLQTIVSIFHHRGSDSSQGSENNFVLFCIFAGSLESAN